MHRFLLESKNDLSPIQHQIFQVLRLKKGEEFIIFDGKTNEEDIVKIDEIDRDILKVSLVSKKLIEDEAQGGLTIFVSPPKKASLIEEILIKSTEVGVKKVALFKSDRCEYKGGLKKSRIEKILSESCEQSGRTKLLEFEDYLNSKEEVNNLLKNFDSVFVSGINGGKTPTVSSTGNCALIIGPEGGLSEEEISDLVGIGAKLISFPGPVMKVSTACTVLAGCLLNK